MKVTTDNVDRFVKLPLHILKSRISPRALAVWSAISRNGSVQKPLVWVRQPTVAEDLHCSTDTVSRALKELEKAGFIAYTGFRHQGRHKIYRIFWAANNVDAEVSPTANLRTDLPQKCGNTLRIDAALPSAPVQEDNPQACRNLSRIREEQEENISLELEQVLSIFGPKFANMFPCLDGLSGRPTIRECVEHALNHESRHKCTNIRVFLENWLRNATKDSSLPSRA